MRNLDVVTGAKCHIVCIFGREYFYRLSGHTVEAAKGRRQNSGI
jgi:hypothetical protein